MLGLFQNGDPKREETGNTGILAATSIHAGEQSICVGELLRKGCAFSQLLKDAGCKEGDLFCTVMDKSIDFLISILGINMAGGVVLPVDLDCTIDRFQTIFNESRAKWMIADEHAHSFINSGILARRSLNLGWMGSRDNLPNGMFPEFIRENLDDYPLSSVVRKINPAGFSSVFFKYCKNGMLDAYLLSNREISEFVNKAMEMIHVGSDDRIAGFFPGHIMPFVLEVGMSARINSAVHLYRPSLLKNTEIFLETVRESEATLLLCRSDDLRNLGDSGEKTSPKNNSVRQILIWGDPPSRSKIDLLKELFPNCGIQNFYMVSGREEPERDATPANVCRARLDAKCKMETVYILCREFFSFAFGNAEGLPTIREVHHAHWKKRTITTGMMNSRSEMDNKSKSG